LNPAVSTTRSGIRKLNQLETFSVVTANELKKGDMVLVEARVHSRRRRVVEGGVGKRERHHG
jgi:hypothetical protein